MFLGAHLYRMLGASEDVLCIIDLGVDPSESIVQVRGNMRWKGGAHVVGLAKL